MDAKIVSLAKGPNGGIDVPVEVFNLFHRLLDRNLDLKIDGDRLRVSGPKGSKPELSEAEVADIKRYKGHLMALIAYIPPSKAWDEPFEMPLTDGPKEA